VGSLLREVAIPSLRVTSGGSWELLVKTADPIRGEVQEGPPTHL
jgi:hypothetical protein